MILGNKCDMDDKRMITKERGEAIAREHGIRFLETSAKANINIERAFMELAEAILKKVCIIIFEFLPRNSLYTMFSNLYF